jgi:HEAT repeat protein/type 1 glutamine amidotransferase
MKHTILSIVLSALAILPARIPVSAGEAGAPFPGAEGSSEAIEKLRVHAPGADSKALHRIERWVEESTKDPGAKKALAARLAALLEDPQATPAAKLFVCQALARIGSEAQVPVLEKMLRGAEAFEMARIALEAIPGEAAGEVLRSALGQAQGSALLGLMSSLGARRDPKAVEMLSKRLAAADESLSAAAAEALGRIGTPAAAAALEPAMAAAAGRRQAAIQDGLLACAERLRSDGDAGRAESIYRSFWAKDQPARLRAAALVGLAGVLGPGALPLALEALESGDPFLEGVAWKVMSGIPGKAATEALVFRLPTLDPSARARLVEVLGERGDASAGRTVATLVKSPDEGIRLAAIRALGRLGDASAVELLARLAAGPGGPARDAAAESLAGLRHPDADGKILAGVSGGPPAVRAQLIRAAAARRIPGVTKLLLEAARDADEGVRSSALEALAAWPDLSVADDLLKLARDETERPAKLLALEGYFRLARSAKAGEERSQLFEAAGKTLDSPESKKIFLEALSEAQDPAALELALDLLEDADARVEASGAVLKLARAVLSSRPAAAAEAMGKLRQAASDEAILRQATEIEELAAKAPSPEAVQQALVPDASRSRAQRKELAARAPSGCRLVSYLDCGPDTADGRPGRSRLELLAGAPYFWAGAEQAAHLKFGTVAFHGQEVAFQATGLNAGKSYQLGFSWWDYDNRGRVESVTFSTGKGEKAVTALQKAKLPAFEGQGRGPEERTLDVPRELHADGTLRIAFVNEGGVNAVVSEVWLWEAAAGAEPAKEPKGPEEKKAPAARVLIVTGIDYPGHPWKLTAPALAEVLRKDPRLEVKIVEDPKFLASDEVKGFDVVVMHFMNWEQPDPGPAARANLKAFVEGGKGLLIIHFACGAFGEWPEFRKIAGKVYDPKLRGHDPRGPFKVEITKSSHPALQGLQAFETDDELYTCLAGDEPVEVLATARSKVDGKDYPIAFVLSYGKGRVFHTPLGHDVKAVENPGAADLFRRGCAWAAGLPPTP